MSNIFIAVLACSRRSDSWEQRKVKQARKNRRGTKTSAQLTIDSEIV